MQIWLHNAMSKPFLVLAAHRLRQNLLSRKAGSSDHNSHVQMMDIWSHSNFLDTTPHEMTINENSISRCLVCFPFNQIYATKVCRNYPCAIITFVELQVKTFSSFIIISKQIFSDFGFLNLPVINNSEVILSFVIAL